MKNGKRKERENRESENMVPIRKRIVWEIYSLFILLIHLFIHCFTENAMVKQCKPLCNTMFVTMVIPCILDICLSNAMFIGHLPYNTCFLDIYLSDITYLDIYYGNTIIWAFTLVIPCFWGIYHGNMIDLHGINIEIYININYN